MQALLKTGVVTDESDAKKWLEACGNNADLAVEMACAGSAVSGRPVVPTDEPSLQKRFAYGDEYDKEEAPKKTQQIFADGRGAQELHGRFRNEFKRDDAEASKKLRREKKQRRRGKPLHCRCRRGGGKRDVPAPQRRQSELHYPSRAFPFRVIYYPPQEGGGGMG